MRESRKNVRQKFRKLVEGRRTGPGGEAATDWEPVISIGTAARKVGLSVAALRKYEKEGLLIYSRTETGRRLLCQADIKRIGMIQHMIRDLGLNIEGVRRLLALLPCWDLKLCSEKDRKRCPAVEDALHPCWMVHPTRCTSKGHECRECEVYRYGAYCAVTMKMLLHRAGNAR
jgi:MerR family transcriptional regulator/heat shock protein HspR